MFVCPIIKHGTDDSRAQAKILARNQVMQSMKGGFFEETDCVSSTEAITQDLQTAIHPARHHIIHTYICSPS